MPRERWFGATGRRVPEIAVEGELDLDDALVLDDAGDTATLREAHSAGRPRHPLRQPRRDGEAVRPATEPPVTANRSRPSSSAMASTSAIQSTTCLPR